MDDLMIPHVTPEVVAWLEKLFPDKCPSLSTPDRKVWFDAGSARVVQTLREQLAAQQENPLDDVRAQLAL